MVTALPCGACVFVINRRRESVSLCRGEAADCNTEHMGWGLLSRTTLCLSKNHERWYLGGEELWDDYLTKTREPAGHCPVRQMCYSEAVGLSLGERTQSCTEPQTLKWWAITWPQAKKSEREIDIWDYVNAIVGFAHMPQFSFFFFLAT